MRPLALLLLFAACASPHREAAFAACAFLVDWLKTKAPFWKLEQGPEGERWVAAEAADATAAERWE